MSEQTETRGTAVIEDPQVEDAQFGIGQVVILGAAESASVLSACYCKRNCLSCDTSAKENLDLLGDMSMSRPVGYTNEGAIPN